MIILNYLNKLYMNVLPKLKTITYKNKKHKYRLQDTSKKRKLAIDEGIQQEKNKTKQSLKKAALAKKKRFNILRIYRRYNNVKDCNKITKDMRYIDKKYDLNTTKNICGISKKPKQKRQRSQKQPIKLQKTKQQKQFLYNPDNPKKSFDVYIDKDPTDTINIKYTTVDDVKDTIKKLEKLYKSGKYSHKRIWQVAMIMKVRLQAILKNHPNANNIKSRYDLSLRYFLFLKKRTQLRTFKDRKQLKFKF